MTPLRMMALLKKSGAAGLVLSSLLAGGTVQAAPVQALNGETAVLVHGAFADGSNWDKVILMLEARGLHVVDRA